MRTVVVYKDISEHARPVEEFIRYYKSITGRDLETIEPETRDGISFCTAYGIMEYPTVISMSDDGRMHAMWSGLPLPTVNEVSAYA